MPASGFRTAGVDLASQDNRTALAEIRWEGAGAVVESVRLGVGNDDIVAAAHRVSMVGIDCPVGWPAGFTDLLLAARANVVAPNIGDSDASRQVLAYRLTDRVVRERTGRWPLSVSSDRIAYPAMRCAGVLARLTAQGVPVRRSGVDSRVAEVYPAAALRLWALPTAGYKKDPAARDELLKAIAGQAQWLSMGEFDVDLRRSDDMLDAVVCAVVAGAALLGRTVQPSVEQLAAADEEGWVHLPDRAFLQHPGEFGAGRTVTRQPGIGA